MEKYMKLKENIEKENIKKNSEIHNVKRRFKNLFNKLDSLDFNKYKELKYIIDNKLKPKEIFKEYTKFCDSLFEQIKLEDLFSLRKKLNPLLENNSKIYGKIIEQDIEYDGNLKIEISLTTDYMIAFDNVFLAEDGVYRSVIKLYDNINIPNEENKNIIKKELKEINKKLSYLDTNKVSNEFFKLEEIDSDFLEKMDNKFFANIMINIIEHLCRPYFFEFIGQIDKELFESYELDQYEFYKFNIIDSKARVVYSKKPPVFNGNIIFAASPFEISGKQLILCGTDKITKDINDKNRVDYKTPNNVITYPMTSSINNSRANELNSNRLELNDLLSPTNLPAVKNIKYKINHIGQGFNSYLLFNNNSTILFDIGYSTLPKDKTIKLGKKTYKNKSPKLVILSHWDIDHILGIAHCKKNIFHVPWIVPDINYENDEKVFSLSAKRLNLYLKLTEDSKNKQENNIKQYLYNIDNTFNERKIDTFLIGNYQFNLYKGKGISKTSPDTFTNPDGETIKLTKNSNKKNNIGIYFELLGKKNLLSPGDCDYISLCDDVNNRNKTYDYLIASHHGSYADNPKFNLKKDESIVYVPVGMNDHRLPVHLNNLDNLKKDFNAEIIETQHKGDILIDLSL